MNSYTVCSKVVGATDALKDRYNLFGAILFKEQLCPFNRINRIFMHWLAGELPITALKPDAPDQWNRRYSFVF